LERGSPQVTSNQFGSIQYSDAEIDVEMKTLTGGFC